jgi:hypothetical protein
MLIETVLSIEPTARIFFEDTGSEMEFESD